MKKKLVTNKKTVYINNKSYLCKKNGDDRKGYS